MISTEYPKIHAATVIVNTAYRRIYNLTRLGRLNEAHDTSKRLAAALRTLAKPRPHRRTKFD